MEKGGGDACAQDPVKVFGIRNPFMRFQADLFPATKVHRFGGVESPMAVGCYTEEMFLETSI